MPVFVLLLALFLAGSAFAGESAVDEPAVPLPAADYYLAPDGDDAGLGTADAPFRTLIRARDQIRADKKEGKECAWTVHIRPGEYPISETVRFENVDSGTPEYPVRYIGESDADGAKPVFSGGFEITGWKDEGGVWSADVPVIDGVPFYFEQLFVNDHRCVRAREPNTGYLKVVSGEDENPIDREKKIEPKNTKQSITVEPDALGFLKGVPQEELKYAQAIIHHHWVTTRRIILGVDTEKGVISMKGRPQARHNIWQGDSVFEVENVRSAFDIPGEWFYDGVNSKVYYRPLPGETLETARFIVPRFGLIRLLSIVGGKIPNPNGTGEVQGSIGDISFENLTFSFSDTPRRREVMEAAELDPSVTGPLDKPGPSQVNPGQAARYADFAVEIAFARRIAFQHCDLTHTGEYGINMTNVRDCRIENCDIRDLGAGGIVLTGTGGDSEEAHGFSNYNVIRNNRIREGGRFHAAAVGVLLGNATHDNEVIHNDIEDFFYTGVSVGWTWGYKGGSVFRNRIEYNKIHKIGQYSLADMGGVYTLGTLHGTRICNNVIYDVKSNSYGGWGLYTDEGSEGVTMENNLVYDTTDGSFHQHYGRGNLIRNNIFVDSDPIQVASSRIEPHRSFTFENNLIVWSKGNAIGYNFDKVNAVIRNNLWFCTTGPTLFRDKTHEQMEAKGFDLGGIVADPLFADPANRDYRLKPDSPALGIGFVPFDYSKAGVE